MLALKNFFLTFFVLTGTILLVKEHSSAQNASAMKELKEKEALLTPAEDYIQHSDYARALPLYLKLDALTPNDPVINYKIGLCYLHSPANKLKALSPIEFAAKHLDSIPKESIEEQELTAETYYYLGKAYHVAYRLDDAIQAFEKYKSFLKAGDKKIHETNRQIQVCNTAKDFMANPVNVTITNLGDVINSPFPEYSPCISGDESVLIFTSRRIGSTGNKKTVTDDFYEDIYISYRRADGSWTLPASIGSNINSADHEASVSLSADGQQLFIYKNDKGDGNIYVCNLNGNIWDAPKKLGKTINSKKWEPSASITSDGSTLYFVSNRKGSTGGRDIYMAKKLPNGKWGAPKNLGDAINTPYDEDSPFIHPDGKTLYFSSNGHNTMGGFDIFSSTLKDDGTWTTPKNIGYPINGTDDDIFYVQTAKGNHAYYSSVKNDGNGEQDIYLISLPEEVAMTVVKGVVTSEEKTTEPISAKVTLTDKETGDVVAIFKPNSQTGKYLITLPPENRKKTYNISITRDGYPPHSDDFTLPPNEKYYEQAQEIRYGKRDKNGSAFVSVFNRKILKTEFVSLDEEEDDSIPSSDKIEEIRKKAGDVKTGKKVIYDTIVVRDTVFIRDTVVLKGNSQNIVSSQKRELYYVQVGMWTTKIPPDFKKLTPVKNLRTIKDNKGFIRCIVGGYKEKQEAEQQKEEVLKKGYKDALVILLDISKFTIIK